MEASHRTDQNVRLSRSFIVVMLAWQVGRGIVNLLGSIGLFWVSRGTLLGLDAIFTTTRARSPWRAAVGTRALFLRNAPHA